MLIREQIRQIVNKALTEAIEKNLLEKADFPTVKIEYPKEEKFGDYASSLAMESAKILRKSPMEVGQTLKGLIEQSELVEKVEIAKPGFINVFLSIDFLYKNLMEILKSGDSYGKIKKDVPVKINIEFVSANPTGPMNIVSARAAACGDTIANLFEAAGDVVRREYYINDFGNQVFLLGQSVYCRYRELLNESVDFPKEGYHGEYVKDIAKYCLENFQDQIEGIINEELKIDFFSKKAVELNVESIKKDLKKFNIEYDVWFSEKSLHENGNVQNTLELLESKDLIFVDENKKVFRATNFGDDKDRVVQRDDGRPTYLLSDMAYHRNKMDRGFDLLINIWGPDHHGYIARLKGAMEAMGYSKDALNVLTVQQVNLITDGEAVKMSKRLGNFSTMNELIEDIGVDVARYFFVMRSMDSHLDFDIDLAKRESSENPVFYLQYAHARICSIFNEAQKRGIVFDPGKSSVEYLNNSQAVSLLKHMTRFPEEINDSAKNIEPHRIANYLLKLAQRYHKFYTEHRVLSDDIKKTNTYLSLCSGVRTILKNGLALLGLSAPEKM